MVSRLSAASIDRSSQNMAASCMGCTVQTLTLVDVEDLTEAF